MIRIHSYNASFGNGEGSAFKVFCGSRVVGALLVIDSELRFYDENGWKIADKNTDRFGIIDIVEHYTSRSGLSGEWEIITAEPFRLIPVSGVRVYDDLWMRIIPAWPGEELLIYNRHDSSRIELVKVPDGPPVLGICRKYDKSDKKFETEVTTGVRFKALDKTFRSFRTCRPCDLLAIHLGNNIWDVRYGRRFYVPEISEIVERVEKDPYTLDGHTEEVILETLAPALEERDTQWFDPNYTPKSPEEEAELIIEEVLQEAAT